MNRLRYAAGVVISTAVAIGLILLVLRPAPQIVLLGASAAMISASQRFDASRPRRLLIVGMLFFPAAFSLSVATLLSGLPIVADLVFLAVIFTALWAFGRPVYGQPMGTVAFMMFFFALFIRAKPAELPVLYLALLIALASTAVVTVVVLRNPARPMIQHIRRSYRARLSQVLDAGLRLLEAPNPELADARRLRRRVARLHEAALAIETELGAAGEGELTGLQRRILDSELAVERLAGEIGQAYRQRLSLEQRLPLAAQLQELRAWVVSGEPVAPHRLAAGSVWLNAGPAGPARSTMWAIAELVEATERAREPFEPPPEPVPAVPTAPQPAQTAATPAKKKLADRVSPTVRRAIQATIGCGLAILAGELLSDQRWYWAVITAFMVFVGTGSAGQTLVKGFRRVMGTMIGVVAGTVVASLLAGHLGWVVGLAFFCIFAGFYALTLSYGLMVFFITVMLGLLYSLLGTFTPELLLLRLEETAIGAISGMAAAVLVLPTTATAAAREATATLLAEIRGFVGSVGEVLVDAEAINLIDAAREIDANLATLHGTAEPVTHRATLLRGRRNDTKFALALLDSAAYHVRGIAANAEIAALAGDDGLAEVSERIRENLQLLSDSLRADYGRPDQPLRTGPSPSELIGAHRRIRAGDREPAPMDDHTSRVVDHLDRLDRTVTGLASPLGLRIE
jgi:uncharacterized membrane protein YccC